MYRPNIDIDTYTFYVWYNDNNNNNYYYYYLIIVYNIVYILYLKNLSRNYIKILFLVL